MRCQGTAEEFQYFNLLVAKFKKHVCKKFILVFGNHDVYCFRDDWKLMASMLSNVDHCLVFETVNVFGLTIHGCPWCWMHSWDYHVRSPSIDAATAISAAGFDTIPENLDILLTHGPPWSVLDLADATDTYAGTVSGSRPLFEQVAVARPRVHLFGHIHEQHGAVRHGSTLFVNSAMKNRWPSNRAFLQHGPHFITASRPAATEDGGFGEWSFELESMEPLPL
jgi:Icc-related predicted phosphoesterase